MCYVSDRLGHPEDVNAEVNQTEIKMSWSDGKKVM